MIHIGPIPKGTPIGLLANLNPLSESSDPAARLLHDKKVLDLVLKMNSDLKKLPENPSDQALNNTFSNLVDPMLQVSKCPDLIVNRGHYFGTGKVPGEPGLSDDDKRALIAFLKRL